MRYRKIDAIQLYERGNYKPILLVFARGDDGKRYSIRQEGLTSYFWSATEPDYNLDLQKKVKKVESGYTSIYGKPLWKITSKMPGDVIDLRDGLPHHEADIHWPECKLIELGITDGFELNEYNRIVPADASDIELRTWVVDVEVISTPDIVPTWETPQYQTACVIVWDSYEDKQYTFSTNGTNEKEMWKEFLNLLKKHDPDIITGWNVDYDASWIMARMDHLGIDKNALSPVHKAEIRHWTAPDKKVHHKFQIAGRIIFDALAAYKVKKNPSGQMNSYNLHAVAKKELNYEWEDYGDKIKATWEKDPNIVINYCQTDVETEKNIIVKEKLIEQALAVAKLSGCTLPQTTSKEQIIDHAILLRRGNRILPSKPRGEIERDVKGGMVLLPSPGTHYNIGVFDAAALYPSIIAGFNISPETKKKEGTIVIKDEKENEYRFLDPKIQKGIMPETITEFRALRERVRERKRAAEKEFGHDSPQYKALEEEDTADKFIITSFYGVMAFPRFRLFDPDCANAITAVGRMVINGLAEHLKTKGYPVEYGDTDSVFVNCKNLDGGFIVKDLIHDYLDTKLKSMGVTGSEIDVKFEKFFDKIAFKRRKVSKGKWVPVKKKYAAKMTWSEGTKTNEVYVKGFETRRSDTPDILKHTMEHFFKVWLIDDNESGALTLIKNIKNKFEDVNPYEIAVPRQIHTANESSPWWRGMEYGKTLGWRYDESAAPRLLYVKRVSSPLMPTDVICIQEHHKLPTEVEIDFGIMFEKIVKKKFEPILDAMGYHWRVVIDGEQQLDQWFK